MDPDGSLIYQISEEFTQKMQIKDSNQPEFKEFFNLVSTIPESSFPHHLFSHVLNTLVTLPFLQSQISKTKNEILNIVDNRFLKIQEKIKDFDEKFLGLEHRIEVLRKKSSGDTENFTRKILEISTFLTSKPWNKEITEFNEKINSKVNYEDLFSMKSEQSDKIEENLKVLKDTQKQVKDFEGILARMDEILLGKSSKDDLRYLSMQLNSYVTGREVDKLLEDLESRLTSLESYKSEQNTYLRPKKDCSKLSHKNVSKDFSILFNKVNLISTKLEDKVNKIDIFPALEAFESRETTFKRSLDSLLNDIHQISILQQESLKTMVRSLDSAEKKNKIRSELVKASEKLVMNLTIKINDSKSPHHSKSASFARSSVSPDPEKLPMTSIASRKSKRIFIAKSYRVSSNS